MGALWSLIFGWLPSPIPQIILAFLAILLIFFLWKLWILIKDAIPFL